MTNETLEQLQTAAEKIMEELETELTQFMPKDQANAICDLLDSWREAWDEYHIEYLRLHDLKDLKQNASHLVEIHRHGAGGEVLVPLKGGSIQ